MAVFVGIIFVIFLVFLILKRNVDFFHPAILFTIIILGTYFLACLHLSGLQTEYPLWFTMLIFGMVSVFWLGCKVGQVLPVPEGKEIEYYSESTMRLVVRLLWLAIIISFLITTKTLGAPPAISGTNRADYFVSGWGSIVLLQSTLLALLLYDHYNENAVGKPFWFYVVTIAVVAALFANKFQILYMLVLIMAAKNSYGKKVRLWGILVAAAAAVLIFTILFLFVYEDMYGISIDDIYMGYKMHIPSHMKFLTQPYLYAAFNYENLYHYLTGNTHHIHGYKSFNAVISTFHLEGLWPKSDIEYAGEWKAMLKVPSLTTGTMFEDFAQDGGIIWMMVGTFVCGIISSFSFSKFKHDKNYFWFFAFSASVVAVAFSFFSNSFTSKVTFINILASALCGWLIKYTFTFKGKVL